MSFTFSKNDTGWMDVMLRLINESNAETITTPITKSDVKIFDFEASNITKDDNNYKIIINTDTTELNDGVTYNYTRIDPLLLIDNSLKLTVFKNKFKNFFKDGEYDYNNDDALKDAYIELISDIIHLYFIDTDNYENSLKHFKDYLNVITDNNRVYLQPEESVLFISPSWEYPSDIDIEIFELDGLYVEQYDDMGE